MPCSVTARPLTGRFCGPGPSLLATAMAIVAIVARSASCQGWSDPVTTTPSFIQKQFGPAGGVLPGQGENYCGPVTLSMGLYYLGHNGYTKLAPASYTAGNVADEAAAANLALIVGGLAGTSPTGGTYVVVHLDEPAPLGGRAASRRERRRIERLSQMREDFPDRPRLRNEAHPGFLWVNW